MTVNAKSLIFSLAFFLLISSITEALEYSSYVYTTDDIILFSYEDDTEFELYNSGGSPVYFTPDVLDKGEHVLIGTSEGVYRVEGSNKFAVLSGDPASSGVSGYYAMDANGHVDGNVFIDQVV